MWMVGDGCIISMLHRGGWWLVPYCSYCLCSGAVDTAIVNSNLIRC